MSVKVMAEVWEHSQAAGTALLVQLALADHADEESRSCWPSMAHLAHKTRVSRDTVRRALRELAALGELEITRQGGGHLSTRYVLRGYQSATGSKLPGVADSAPRGSTLATSGVAPVLPEPSITVMNRHARVTVEDDEFDKAWVEYPRKVAKKRALAAYRARRRSGVPADELYRATCHYAFSVSGTAPNFIMHGSTFYGPTERWKDFLVAPTSGMVDVEPSYIDTVPDVPSW